MSEQTVPEPVSARETMRAKAGDTMWVLLNHVKPDRRETFEQFMREIIMPIASRTSPEVFNRTRMLKPSEPSPDGTYTYIFLMDPLVPGGEYDFASILKHEHAPEKVEEYLQMFSDSLVGDQIAYEVTQTAW